MSPRRVSALAWLAVKESIRRRVVVAFAVFIVVLLFAGWFLDPGSTTRPRLYMSFVLTATSYLVLVLMLFLSVFSLPADLKSRTLHTVVTKPVRASEIVLGRMLGFHGAGHQPAGRDVRDQLRLRGPRAGPHPRADVRTTSARGAGGRSAGHQPRSGRPAGRTGTGTRW